MSEPKFAFVAFTTFRRGGMTFLCVPNGNQVSICDEMGNNYGSYHDQKSFESFAECSGGFEAIRLGQSEVMLHIVPRVTK